MQNVLVIGLGKVGSLVAILLSKQFTVTGLDKRKPSKPLPFEILEGDVTDEVFIGKTLTGFDAVVSCMPYNLNLPIARAAHQLGIHYFDLTEDVPTTAAIREMAETHRGVMAPQCGLAPGLIGIVGADLAKRFDELRDIELRVGALPCYPNGLLGYSFTWSLHNGERKMVSSLDGMEVINIEGQEFEAFSTSGGLGTMCETFLGKVDTLNYKTIRYPGHAKLMRFLLYELILKNRREQLEEILTAAKPPVKEDVVYVYAVVEGWQADGLAREEFYRAYHPRLIDGQAWRAISWTTAASIAAVVEMVAAGTLPQKGFLKQEEIPFEAFLATKNGAFFRENN